MRRRRRRQKKDNKCLRVISIYLIVISIIAAISYIIFFIPSEINSGVVIETKESTKYVNLKLAYNNKTKWVKVNKSSELKDSIAYNVKLSGYRVKSITPCSVYTGKVLCRTSKNIEMDNGILNINSNTKYAKIVDGELKRVYPKDLIVGSTNNKFVGDTKSNISLILVSEPELKNILVGISNNNFSSLNHSSLTFQSKKGLELEYSDINYKVKRGDALRVAYKNGEITLSLLTKKEDTYILKSVIGQTKERVKIYSASGHQITIPELKRTHGYVPGYYGSFEVYINKDFLRLINEVDVEDYLKFVVPSEMLGSGGIEGYKVQAVAARTYVLSDTLSGRFAAYGFHVDDTTMSQMYNSMPSNTLCDKAIEETAGIVMTYNKGIIDAKYYSTSCGVGAPFNEVWYNNKPDAKNPEPYLAYSNFTDIEINNLSNEDNASAFFKDWTIKAYDSNSPFFRWKFSLDRKTLNETINKNIYERYSKNPKKFQKKWYFNIYRKTSIPKEGIGKIKDIYICKRGKAGNVMEMVIESETGTYKIQGDLNIRKLLTPVAMTITPLYGKKMENVLAIPSSFFVIDKDISSNTVKSITIYGGGYGHGAGMSQYGVIGLVRQEKDYKEILNIYYKDIKLEDYKSIVNSSI